MNLGDPELELIDPTPNVHNLFIQFDQLFFGAILASRAVVKWSKRMYSCAGVCSYEGRGGLCVISLSEPLLKLRPRKDIVETLLHEMIHAYLFITCRDNDRDGHGPNFKAHMYRINKIAGINITIYHDFHDEVKLYQTVWRCNGPCRQRRPYFGIVRRSVNRAPGPSEYWWETHKRSCGGTYIKIKEPEKIGKKNDKAPPKPKADITKYVNIEKTVHNVPQTVPTKPVLKDSSNIPNTKSNGGNTLVINRKSPVFNPQAAPHKSPILFGGKGQTLANTRPRSNSVGVVEQVRSVWANKQLPTNPAVAVNNKQVTMPTNIMNNTMSSMNKVPKHKIDSHNHSPPAKQAKIGDYFKNTASSILKDLYGNSIQITQSKKDQKFVAVTDKNEQVNTKSAESEMKTPKQTEPQFSMFTNVVDCPVCSAKVSSNDINRHLDECLNKDVIETLCKDDPLDRISILPSTSSQSSKKELQGIVGVLPTIPAFKGKTEIIDNVRNEMIAAKAKIVMDTPIYDNTNHLDSKVQEELNTAVMDIEKDIKRETEDPLVFNPTDIQKVKAIVKKINFDKMIKESNIFVKPNEEKPNFIDFGFLPSFLDEVACKIENPKIKIEPGISRDIANVIGQKCACCGNKIDKPMEEHLDECLAFFKNNNTIPNEGASTSFANEPIVIDDDDDDIFDDSQIFNATGTKTPCPCCLTMVEEGEMNNHLDQCLLGD